MLQDKYNRIIQDKLPKGVAQELKQIADDTNNFEDEEIVEIYKDNFNDLFKIIEDKYPEALKAKKKLIKPVKVKIKKPAESKKKLVKKAEPKKKLKKAAELPCDDAKKELKKIESKKAQAVKARAEAPKKKASTAAREKQVKALSSLFKTKTFKEDKNKAEKVSNLIVSIYKKNVSNEFATSLQKDINQLIKTKYGVEKMAKGGKIDDSDTPKVYVADLAAYNNGKLIGEWIDLSEYSSGEEVMQKISELLKKWGKKEGEIREEYAIHDFENFPESMYSEGMGEKSFDEVIEYYNFSNDNNISQDAFKRLINYYGDIEEAKSAVENGFYGPYKDEEDFAIQMVDDLGGIQNFNNPELYLYISETDKRLLAQEEADRYVDDIKEEDEGKRIIEEADMDVDEFENASDEEKEKMIKEASDIVYEKIYEEWNEGLDDPYDFLVEQQGLYSKENLKNATFVQIDYEKLAKDLAYDYVEIDAEDGFYYFNNSMAKGGKIKSPKMKDGGQIEDKTLKQKYSIIRRWNDNIGTDEEIEGVIKALIKGGVTDKDMHTKPTKTGSQYTKAKEDKTKELIEIMEKNYDGNLKGNQPYMIIYTMVDRATRFNDNIIEQFKSEE